MQELSKTSAFNIQEDKRSEYAEKTIIRMFEGEHLRDIAKDLGKSTDTILAHISKSETYLDLYARAKVSKGLSLIDSLLDLSDDMTGNETQGELAKIDRQIDTRKWVVGKYAQHFGKAVEALSSTPNAATPSIVINVAQPKQEVCQVVEIEADK
jgi:hypothetical protein